MYQQSRGQGKFQRGGGGGGRGHQSRFPSMSGPPPSTNMSSSGLDGNVMKDGGQYNVRDMNNTMSGGRGRDQPQQQYHYGQQGGGHTGQQGGGHTGQQGGGHTSQQSQQTHTMSSHQQHPYDMNNSMRPNFNHQQQPRQNLPPLATHNRTSPSLPPPLTPESPQPTDDETVKFIGELWRQVYDEYKRRSVDGPFYYEEKELADLGSFEPIDLEGWRSRRLSSSRP